MHWKKLTNVKDQNKLDVGNIDYDKMQSQLQLQRS